MTIVNGPGPGHCNFCSTEKAKRAPVSKNWGTRAMEKLAIVHTDVLGPVRQSSYESFRYAIGFIDSFARYAVMYPMRSKDEVLGKLELFLADVGKPQTLVSDGALEFKSRGFSDKCRKNGIRQEFSAPYTPHENGKIGRVWGTVTGMARCMMDSAGLPQQFWPYALAAASPLCPQFYSIRDVPWNKAQPGHHAALRMSCNCIRREQEETGQQGSKGNLLGLLQ